MKRLLSISLSLAAVTHAEERMRAGLWEVITTVDGKPSGTTGGTCYTSAMVQLANSPAPALKEATMKSMTARHCTLNEFKLEGRTISMKSVCGPRSLMTSSMYGVDSFETNSSATTGGVTTTSRMKGRRLGDCK